MNLRRMYGVVAVALALAIVCCVAILPGAQASYLSGSNVYLLDDGRTSINATTDWRFTVEVPNLGTDADTLSFDVTATCLDPTGATEAAYTVYVYLNDGTLNKSGSVAITVNKTVDQTGVVNITGADLFTATESATLTIILKNATAVQKDIYIGTVTIYAHAYQSSILDMIDVVISITIFGAMIGLVGKFGKKAKGGRK